MQISDLCVPAKVANSAENSVLQALQFQELSARCILLCKTGINHYWLNYDSIWNTFNKNSNPDNLYGRPMCHIVKGFLDAEEYQSCRHIIVEIQSDMIC
jgi:hypothetical protein